jgi:hypothetical protein
LIVEARLVTAQWSDVAGNASMDNDIIFDGEEIRIQAAKNGKTSALKNFIRNLLETNGQLRKLESEGRKFVQRCSST